MPPITAAQLDALIAGYPAASNWPAQADAALIECRVQMFGPTGATGAIGPTGGPTGPTAPGPGCAGFTVSNMEVPWPKEHNENPPLPFFGPNTAIVAHFKVTGDFGQTALFTIGNTSGPNYNHVRMSLAAVPGCNTPTSYPPELPILWAAVSQNPPLKLIVGMARAGYVTVQPGGDYWVTIVNRGGYPGVNTCPRADCGTSRRIDFNTRG